MPILVADQSKAKALVVDCFKAMFKTLPPAPTLTATLGYVACLKPLTKRARFQKN